MRNYRPLHPSATPTPTWTPTPFPTPTPTPTLAPAPEGPQIIGPEDFTAQVQWALDLLWARAPQVFDRVKAGIATIMNDESDTRMDVYSKTFFVQQGIAFAAGYPEFDQAVWLAGTFVNNSCHSLQYAEGRPFSGRDADVECMREQYVALRAIGVGGGYRNHMSNHVASMIRERLSRD